MPDFPRNRYDSTEFVRLFDASDVTDDCGETCVMLKAAHDLTDEFAIYFPSTENKPSADELSVARKLCSHIGELDNLVQESCESEAKRNDGNPKDYALYLAFAEIDAQDVRLEYYGTFVNTQWSAMFRLCDAGNWIKTNF